MSAFQVGCSRIESCSCSGKADCNLEWGLVRCLGAMRLVVYRWVLWSSSRWRPAVGVGFDLVGVCRSSRC